MPETSVITGQPAGSEEHLDTSNRVPHEADAFAELFQTYYRPLMRYARRLTSAATASDVLQDVFLKLWEDRLTITVGVSLKAMLYTMVRNKALNDRRRQARIYADTDVEAAAVTGRLRAADVDDYIDAADNIDAEDRIDADLLAKRLHSWIAELPPRRAEAFVLSRYSGLSHEEIASVMGVSKRTAETHIVHALRDLRGRLDRLGKEGIKS